MGARGDTRGASGCHRVRGAGGGGTDSAKCGELGKRYYNEVATYGVFVVSVGASAVAPDVVHAYDDGEHGEQR